MSTATNRPTKSAKGNLQGQTTLAAKIDRWQNMSNNVLVQIDGFPQLKAFQAKFQQVIADAQALRIQMKVLEASSLNATARRNELISAGDDLFSRLQHGLKSALGPKNERLAQYGVKRTKSGPKPKAAQPTPPTVEAQGKTVPGQPEK